jgi:hypothetical protein
MDVARILIEKYPGMRFSVVGDEIKRWPDDVKKPTQKQLEKWWPEVKAKIDKELLQAERAEALQKKSDDSARNIPGWAKWSERQALDYIEQNVTDLESAKAVLKAMARMILALRDKSFQNIVVEDDS